MYVYIMNEVSATLWYKDLGFVQSYKRIFYLLTRFFLKLQSNCSNEQEIKISLFTYSFQICSFIDIKLCVWIVNIYFILYNGEHLYIILEQKTSTSLFP